MIRAELGSYMLLTTTIVNEKGVNGKMFLTSAFYWQWKPIVMNLGLCVNKCSLSVIGINNMAAISVVSTCGIDVFSNQSVLIFKLIMLLLSQ